jgi:mRNA-degrading endonuclease RelE of RelBE toxin-antitoxin system
MKNQGKDEILKAILAKLPQYRRRVGEVRVFYDVTREAVEVLAIVTKAEAARWLADHGAPNPPSGAG